MTMNTQKAGNGVTLAKRVLPNLAQAEAQELAALRAERDRLAAENEALRAAKSNRRVTCKVAQSGGMSVYGFGRFPVTLFKSQWELFFQHEAEIRAFFEANKRHMTDKS